MAARRAFGSSNCRPPRAALFELRCDVLGVLFVALKDLQPRRQKILELGIARRRNELALKRAVDGFVIGDLIVDIGLIEGGEFGALVAGLLGQCLAGVVVLRRDI